MKKQIWQKNKKPTIPCLNTSSTNVSIKAFLYDAIMLSGELAFHGRTTTFEFVKIRTPCEEISRHTKAILGDNRSLNPWQNLPSMSFYLEWVIISLIQNPKSHILQELPLTWSSKCAICQLCSHQSRGCEGSSTMIDLEARCWHTRKCQPQSNNEIMGWLCDCYHCDNGPSLDLDAWHCTTENRSVTRKRRLQRGAVRVEMSDLVLVCRAG